MCIRDRHIIRSAGSLTPAIGARNTLLAKCGSCDIQRGFQNYILNLHSLNDVMLVDKKILAGGIAMIIVGISLSAMLTDMTPIGREGMTDEEIVEFLTQERENEDFTTLAGILVGIGFLLILISFGARKKRKGGAKKTEKKPATK